MTELETNKASSSALSVYFFSVPPDMLPISFGRDVLNEGAFAQASCIVTEGDEPLAVT